MKRTVFVLGAGASMPYGFPSGPALRHEICTETLRPGDPRHAILIQLGFRHDAIEKCRIAIARSWASSIDMFVAARSDHREIAKAAIALTIAVYERDNDLFFAEPGGDWFRYLWKLLHKSANTSFPQKLVTFVTFNYDRTLEHSFANAIMHARGIDRVTEQMLPQIVHVYGSLGAYPLADGTGFVRCFAEPSSPENIREAFENTINVISEKTSDSQWPLQAQELLREAEQVIFLGFGYDDDNLKNLRLLATNCCLNAGCHLYGTALGLTDRERGWTSKIIGKGGKSGGIALSKREDDCLMFLREEFQLLRAGHAEQPLEPQEA